jgi:mannose-1-phosphate guanylyltransferase
VAEQLPGVPAEQILAEPEGRDTAPAIGWALKRMGESLEDPVVAVLPADHRFGEPEAFRRTLALAAEAAREEDRIMTLGVEPRWAETGYGYLEVGEVLDEGRGVRRVTRFEEKPDAATAERYLAGGCHLWNAGIFVFRAGTLLRELYRLAPGIGAGLEAIARDAGRTDELYAELPKKSIDYAVMEHLEDLGTLPLDCGWSDLGSWEALAEILPEDTEGNRTRGDVLALDARNNLLYAEEGTIAVLGVEGVAVVRTGDAVLVIPRDRTQEVKRIVDELKNQRRTDRL